MEVDDLLLQVSGACLLGFGGAAALSPGAFHSAFWEKGQPVNTDMNRYFGVLACSLGSVELGVSSKDVRAATKRKTLRIAGAGWCVAGALNALAGAQGKQREAISYVNGAWCVALGAAMLYRSFKKDSSRL